MQTICKTKVHKLKINFKSTKDKQELLRPEFYKDLLVKDNFKKTYACTLFVFLILKGLYQ